MLVGARKLLCHTAPDDEKQSETEKKPQTLSILWCRRNRHTHTKSPNCRTTHIQLHKKIKKKQKTKKYRQKN